MPLRSEGRVDCRSCGRSTPSGDLDRQLWCPACREGLEARTRRASHLVAAVVTLPFLVWILMEGRFRVLPLYAWLLPLVAAYYLGLKIGRELAGAYLRWRRTQGGAVGERGER